MIGWLPLHLSCRNGQTFQVIELLVDRGGVETLMEATPAGDLALHLAIEYGQTMEVIQLLVSKFPEALRIRNGNGLLPVELARQEREANDPVIQWLEEETERRKSDSLFRQVQREWLTGGGGGSGGGSSSANSTPRHQSSQNRGKFDRHST